MPIPTRVRPPPLALIIALLLALPTPGWAQGSPAEQEAARLYQAGEWSAAASAYEDLVVDRPDDALALLRLGRALIEVEREEDALEVLERSAAAGMQSPFLSVYRARALVRLGRVDEALGILESIQASPAVGGATPFRQNADFQVLEGTPRYDAFLETVEAAAYPCRADPVSRQLDFWIGSWAVFANGQRAGTNTVEPLLSGCALLENWTNVQGREGKSFNWVDRSSGAEPRWRQLWIADQGNTLDYHDGYFEDDTMHFQGRTVSPAGDTILQRLDFVDVHPDTVRQIFYQSTDGGDTWDQTWVGLYVRMTEAADSTAGG